MSEASQNTGAPVSAPDTPTSPWELTVERFSLHDGRDDRDDLLPSIHFEQDSDLYVNTKVAAGGTYAGVVLVALGIDGYASHHVSVDTYPTSVRDEGAFDYKGDTQHALSDAVAALEAVVEQLRVMRSAAEDAAAHRNTASVVAEAVRAGHQLNV